MLCNALALKVRRVDKHSGRAVGVCQVSFKDLNCERQPITFEFWCFQNHDGVVDCCVIFAED